MSRLKRGIIAKSSPLPFLYAALSILFSPDKAMAHGDVFHMYSPVIEKGDWGLEAINAYQTGLPNGPDAERVLLANEFTVHADITDYWMGNFTLHTIKEDGDNYKVDNVIFESVLRADKWTLRTFDAAWYSGLKIASDGAATNAFAFGPVFSLYHGPIAIIANIFLEKTFGQNKEEGIELYYAWRATYQIIKEFSVGFEAYGLVENLGNSPPGNLQPHRLGPVLYFGQVHGNPHRHANSDGHNHASLDNLAYSHTLQPISADVGVLFGMTDNTSDTAIKANIYAHY